MLCFVKEEENVGFWCIFVYFIHNLGLLEKFYLQENFVFFKIRACVDSNLSRDSTIVINT